MTGFKGTVVLQLSHGPKIWKVYSRKGESGKRKVVGGEAIMLSENWVGLKAVEDGRWL